MGRKAHQADPVSRRQVEAMAGYGVSEKDIARVLAIDPKTLRKHYREELDTGQIKATAKVAESLFRKATGDGAQSVTAAIFWLKTRGQWKETLVNEVSIEAGDSIKQLLRRIAEHGRPIHHREPGGRTPRTGWQPTRKIIEGTVVARPEIHGGTAQQVALSHCGQRAVTMGRRAHKPDPAQRRQVEAMAGYGIPEAAAAGATNCEFIEGDAYSLAHLVSRAEGPLLLNCASSTGIHCV